MNRKNVVAIFLCLFGVRATAQTHLPVALENGSKPLVDVFVSGDGALVAKYQGDHNDIVMTSDSVRRLSFGGLLSPSRDRYFYVEVLPTFNDGVTEPNYDDKVPAKYRPRDRFWDWDNNPVAMRVHVHRLSGERVTTVDLPSSYCGNYARGQWLGDRWIWLRHRYGHRSGNFYSLFVNVATGEKRALGWQIRKAKATPDGRFVTLRRNTIFYLDFRPVYPIYGEKVADFGDKEGWESYKQKYLVRMEKRPHELLGDADLRVMDYDFTPDSKKAVLMTSWIADERPRRDLMGKPIKFVTSSHLVVLDLDELERTHDVERYSLAIPLPPNAIYLARDDEAGEFRVLGPRGELLCTVTFAQLALP